jgi:hypothetical protein
MRSQTFAPPVSLHAALHLLCHFCACDSAGGQEQLPWKCFAHNVTAARVHQLCHRTSRSGCSRLPPTRRCSPPQAPPASGPTGGRRRALLQVPPVQCISAHSLQVPRVSVLSKSKDGPDACQLSTCRVLLLLPGDKAGAKAGAKAGGKAGSKAGSAGSAGEKRARETSPASAAAASAKQVMHNICRIPPCTDLPTVMCRSSGALLLDP